MGPCIKCSVLNTVRPCIWAWTDASWELNAVAAVVYSQGAWQYAYFVVHEQLKQQWLTKADNHIGVLEIVAVVLLLSTFSEELKGTAVFIFTDNDSVLGSLLKGGSKGPEVDRAAGWVWLECSSLRCVSYFAHVEPKANVAEGPSRLDFSTMMAFDAVVVPGFMPDWTRRWWLLCED